MANISKQQQRYQDYLRRCKLQGFIPLRYGDWLREDAEYDHVWEEAQYDYHQSLLAMEED